MAKYLDENGLLYFWQKIKNVFALASDVPTKVSDLTNDRNFEENQNAFSTIKVGSTNVEADAKTDVLELVGGTGITLTPDSTNDKVTITRDALTASDIPDLSATYALKTDISAMYKYKGSVATATLLPTSGQTVGDVYNIEAASIYGGAGMNVAWNGSAWDPLGEIFTITAISNADIDTVVAS